MASLPAPTPGPRCQHERGIPLQLDRAFFRPESCWSRDLGVLSLVAHRRQRGAEAAAGATRGTRAPPPPLRVLDLMSGSGVRGVRYLLHAGADEVVCNEPDPANTACLAANLGAAAAAAARAAGQPPPEGAAAPGGGRRWRVGGGAGAEPRLLDLTHQEATSLLLRARLERRYFDLIDSDSFGAASLVAGPAMGALRHGGLLCLTTTAGTIAGGRDPASALALFGQHLAPLPSANEQGLRLLLGLAWREAAARRLSITPLWSLYSPHGPVWRAMLRVERQPRLGAAAQLEAVRRRYGYVAHWPASGESACCGFHDLPAWLAAGGAGDTGSGGGGGGGRGGGTPPLLSGPLWLGPLHDRDHLLEVRREAAARGWLEAGTEGPGAGERAPPAPRKGGVGSLGRLLELLGEEAEAEAAGEGAAAQRQRQQGCCGAAAWAGLLPWHIRMNDVGRAGGLERPPARDLLAAELRRRGFLAARTHVDRAALRTDAPMREAVAAAQQGLGIRSRRRRAVERGQAVPDDIDD